MNLDKSIIIIGPSAVGKTSIAKGLENSDLPIKKVVTTTTRAQRPGEVEGIDYHFLTNQAFEDLIAKNGFIEHAKYNNHYYGSQAADVQPIIDAGQIPLWVTDSQGADFFKANFSNVFTIFIMPADFETLRRRLEKRKMAKEEITNRIRIARKELLNAPKADARIVNYDGKIKLVIAETANLIRKHFGLPE
jgi:guanylate kinase